VRFAIEFFGDDLEPGDVIVANDPYHGGGHLPDFNVFAPVFADDGESLRPGPPITGPALVQSKFTTIVLGGDDVATVLPNGDVLIEVAPQ